MPTYSFRNKETGEIHDEIMRIARMDKKFEKGRIRFVLLNKAGDAYVSKDVLEGHLINAIDEIRKPV